MTIYAILGVDWELIDMWRSVHETYRIKGKYTSMIAHGMRTTG